MNELEKLVERTPTVQTAKLKEAFEKTVEQIHTLWETSPSEDHEGREACYRELHAGRAFLLHLMRNL